MDMYLRQAWKDPRLSMRRFGINRTLTLNGQHLFSRMWKPDLFFVNAKEVRTHSVTMPNELLQLSPDGDILFSIRLTMKLSCLMLFHNFPFDKQKCYALAHPYAHPLNQVTLVWRETEPVFLEQPIEMQDFDLMTMSYDDYTEEIETDRAAAPAKRSGRARAKPASAPHSSHVGRSSKSVSARGLPDRHRSSVRHRRRRVSTPVVSSSRAAAGIGFVAASSCCACGE
ncbi:unnamed protein product, partial [Ixodes hexagonus]